MKLVSFFIIFASFVGAALGVCGVGINCPPIKDPICAENALGRRLTFDSSCHLVQHNCRKQNGLQNGTIKDIQIESLIKKTFIPTVPFRQIKRGAC
jgi:hypothetical protein